MVINQVNRLFLKQYLTKQFYRNVFYAKPRKVLYPLLNRSLLKVSGQDAVPFLQGLITNDMEHLQDGANSIYAMFLNNKGRVLYDTVIYRWENDNTFLVECDKTSNNLVMKHLKMYRLRKDVEIDDINSEFRLYALITPTDLEVDTDLHPKKKINVFKDPRLIDLGHRVIVARKAGNQFLENNFGECTFIENDDTGYKYLRYKLGVSEGSLELSPGVCFPLESNCDYLHGVSFHKGCYIGQELTARVHHTGVVRKRIMPLRFQDVIISDIEKNTTISTNDTKPINLGKFINSVNDFGIGLVRCKEATEAKIMKIGDVWAEVVKPSWWPIEAPKEKIVTNKPVIE